MRKAIAKLKPFNKEKQLNVIVETPKGSRNKYKFDEEIGLFCIAKVLPEGMSFPHNFGFVPGTEGEDGDPVDVLLLMDEPALPGCVATARVVGIIEAEQTEDGETERNDRIIAVETNCREFEEVKDSSDITKRMRNELEQFFVQYNKMSGKKFKILKFGSAKEALKSIEKSIK